MNRLQIIDAVKGYLNRSNLPSATVGLWIATVEGELNRELRDHPRNVRRGVYLQPAGDPMLPLPSLLSGIILLRGPRGPMRQWPATTREKAERCGGFIARGDALELFPTPTQDTRYDLDFHSLVQPLEADQDDNWISRHYPDLYIYGCLKEAAVYLKDDQRLALWQQDYLTRLKGIQLQGWNQNIAAGPRVANG